MLRPQQNAKTVVIPILSESNNSQPSRIVIDPGTYAFISKSVESAGNRHEVGGILLGHKQGDTLYIIAATTPKVSTVCTWSSFYLDGETETAAMSRLADDFEITPELLGTWHSHINGNRELSSQDRESGRILFNCTGASLSIVATRFEDRQAFLTSYHVHPNGTVIQLSTMVDEGPSSFVRKRR